MLDKTSGIPITSSKSRKETNTKLRSHPVQAVGAPSHAIWVDEFTSYHITKLQYQLEEISRQQNNNL
jgi:hypothetical protein